MGLFKMKKELRGIGNALKDALGLTYAINSTLHPLKLSAVYRCVEVISDSVAQLPLLPYFSQNGRKFRLEDHPTYPLLFKEPNRRMTRYTFFKLIVSQMLLTGNAYAYIRRNSENEIKELIFVPSAHVTIITPTNYEEDIKYSVVGFNRYLEYNELLHFLNYTEDGIHGISTLTHAASVLKAAGNAENTADSFFSTGGNISGIISVDAALTSQQKIDIRDSWRNTFLNTDNKNGVAVLEGSMKFQPLTVNPVDAQLLETRAFNVVEICRFFGVSPVKIFDLSKSSYSTVEATQLAFLTDTLAPILEKIELELERKLYTDAEKKYIDVKFDINNLLRADLKTLSEYYSKLFNIGVMSPNEIRNVIDLDRISDGDMHFVQVNMQDLGKFNNGEKKDEEK